MRSIVKWFLILGGVAVGCLAALTFLIYLLFLWTVPEGSGMQKIAGLDGEVEIVRDKENIPHILAENRLDAARALGFVHAQDRLWQMHVLRMAGQGRLSEMFGAPTIETDRFIRTLDLATPAQDAVPLLENNTRAYLEAYADGVNAYLDRDRRMFDSGLPPEFLILGVTPEPWKPWHSALILKVMDLSLGANMGHEIKRLKLASKGFSPTEIEDILPHGPRETPEDLPDLRQLFGIGSNLETLGSVGTDKQTAGLAFEIGVTASNNWVISGSRTKSGKPILANDPHLGFTAPAVFYLAHISYQQAGETNNVIGGTLPGVPAFLVGRNDKIAWGLTTTYLDAQDIFIERLDPKDAGKYLTPTGSEAFGTKDITIKVSDGDDVVFERRTTRHGPVLPMTYKKLEAALPKKHVAALQWTAISEPDTTMDSVILMMEASTVDGFVGSFKKHVSPMQSIVVGDVQGNIGVIAPGKIPVRSAENKIAGRAPVPGWLPEYDWQGFLSADQVPTFINPQEGAIATANANWLPQSYPHHITSDWAEHFRQARVNELIVGRKETHDIASTLAAMGEAYSPGMVKLRDVAFGTMPSGVTFDPDLLRALKSWNGVMNKDRPEPLIMIAWFRNLHKYVFSDDLQENFELFEKGDLTALVNVLENSGARDWCDDLGSTPVENCSQAFASAFESTLEELQSEYGSDWINWRWGDAHIAYGEHRPFGRVGLLSRLFNVTVPISGGPYTLLRGQTDFGKDNPYLSRHGSVYRAVYDFSDLEKSMFIQSTGQSGHFLSEHYSDFAKRWADMKFVPMQTSRDAFSKEAKGTWRLLPN